MGGGEPLLPSTSLANLLFSSNGFPGLCDFVDSCNVVLKLVEFLYILSTTVVCKFAHTLFKYELK